MKITTTGRKVVLKDSFKALAEKKLKKIGQFFDEDAEAQVTVTVEKNRQTVEVTVRAAGMIFRAEETDFDMEDALERVDDQIIRQIRKNKTRLEKRLRPQGQKPLSFAAGLNEDGGEDVEEEDIHVSRVKHFAVKPMEPEEAILQMNMLGHQFFMFKNMDTGETNVVYCRHDGEYGLLEPEDE